ncbi:hypothetical protein COOONC_15266 [Cooperia oncophora]
MHYLPLAHSWRSIGEKRKPLHMASLDLEQACDRVPHQLIWYALREHGVPEALISWIRMLYMDTTSRVRCAAGLSKSFPMKFGVHQGRQEQDPDIKQLWVLEFVGITDSTCPAQDDYVNAEVVRGYYDAVQTPTAPVRFTPQQRTAMETILRDLKKPGKIR